MPIDVTCACGQTYAIREEFAGQRVQCPFCQQMLTIPTPDRPAATPPVGARPTPTPALFGSPTNLTNPTPSPSYPLPPDAPAPRGGGGWLMLGLIVVIFLVCGGGVIGVAVVAVVGSDGGLAALFPTQPVPTTVAAPTPTVPRGTGPAVPPRSDVPPPPELPPAKTGFAGHLAPVVAIAFADSATKPFALSAAGGFDATGDKPVPWPDNTVREWDALTGQETLRARNFRDGIRAAAFSPDGNYAVLAGECKWEDGAWSIAANSVLHLWDLQKDAEVRSFEGPKGKVMSLAFSPDGTKVLSGWNDNSIHLWDRATGNHSQFDNNHQKGVTCVAFSPDGLYALSGSADKTVRLWDVKKGTEKKLFSGHKDEVWAVAFSPDNKQIVSAGGPRQAGEGDCDIRLWNVASGQEERRFQGHKSMVFCLAFSRDGRRLLSGGHDKTVRLWQVAGDTPVANEVAQFTGNKGDVRAVAFFPDGRRALSGGEGKELLAWDLPPEVDEVFTQLDSADRATRLAALRQLAGFAPAVVRPKLPELLKALARDDEEFCTVLLKVLTRLGPPAEANAAPLAPLFDKSSFAAVRLYALDGLANLGTNYAPTKATFKIALADKDLAIKRKAVQLAGKLGEPAHEDLYPVLVGLLGDADADVAKSAAESLGKLGKPTAKDRPALNDLLRQNAKPTVRFALTALGEMGAEAAPSLPRIGELFTVKSTDPELRRLAFATLLKVQTDKKERTRLLTGAMKDDDPEVAKQAVKSLATLVPEPDATAAFLDALNHANAAVAKIAEDQLPQAAFERANAKAVAAALRANKSEAVRLQLMDKLVALKPEADDIGLALRDMLRDSSGNTQLRVIAAIGELGDAAKDAGPALAELMNLKDPVLRFEAAIALCKLRSDKTPPKAISLLISSLLLDDDTDKKQLEKETKAHEALVKVGKPAVDELGKALTLGFFGPGLPKARARMAVIRTLAAMGADAKDAIPALAECTRTDNFPGNRVEAKKAWTKIQQAVDGK